MFRRPRGPVLSLVFATAAVVATYSVAETSALALDVHHSQTAQMVQGARLDVGARRTRRRDGQRRRDDAYDALDDAIALRHVG